MTTQKRFVAVLLTILMMMQMLPLNALAEAAWKLGGEASVEGAAYHRVTFTSEDKQIAKQLFENGSPIVTMPEDPAKAGYRFVGWFDGEQEISVGTTVQNDIEAVAKFEPIVTYTVTIQYLANEKPVADEVVRQYTADDPADTILSPASVSDGAEGFLYPDQTSVTVTPSELEQENTIIKVHYVAANAEYTVRHMAKNLADEGYTEIESEQHHGVIGTFVVPEPKEYAYYDFERAEGKTLEAAGTVIEVYYTRKPFVLNYDSQGGSYIVPKTGLYEEQVDVYTKTQGEGILSCGLVEHTHEGPVGEPGKNKTSGCYKSQKQQSWLGGQYVWVLNCSKKEHTHDDSCYFAGPVSWDPAPTRTGYTFAGWYLDADCTQPAAPTIQLMDNTTVYAKWEAREVNYTVVYLTENADDNNYSYLTSSIGTAVVGDTVTGSRNAPAGLDTKNFTFKDSTSSVVKADGSTVVTVRYSRNVYTITWSGRYYYEENKYKDNYGNAKLTAKYGANITELWKKTFNAPCPNYAWNFTTNNKDKFVNIDTMPSGNKTVYAFYFATSNVQTLHYWLENYEGSQSKTRNGVTYGLYKAIDVKFNYLYSNSEFYDIVGYTQGDYEGCTFGKGTTNGQQVHFYYRAQEYNLDLYGYQGVQLSTNKVKLNANFSAYLKEPVAPVAGSTFDGWFVDPEHTTKYEGNYKMPQGLALYASWTLPKVNIFFDIQYDNGDGTITKYTYTYGDKADSVVPDKREGYTFEGWYTDLSYSNIFDFNKPIMEDVTVYAKWKINDLSYTVHYYKTGTADPVYADRTVSNAAFTVGQKITENSVAVQGYRADAISKSINLQAGMNEIIFYYTQRAAVNYSVRYLELGTGSPLKDPETYPASQYTERVTVTAPDISGYYPQQIVQSLLLTTNEAENLITFYYVAYGRTTFNVSYVDMEGNQLAEPVIVSRLIGDSFTADQKEFSDYTFDSIEGNDGNLR